MNKLLAVSPADITAIWPSVRADVASVEAPDGFIPEDAYAMCKSNAATLFLLEVDGKRVGFMIARLMLPDLHIWMLKADNGYDVMTSFRPELMELARNANANKLTYGSTRKAWAKVAPDHGFKMRMIVYEAPVDPAPEPVEIPSPLSGINSEEVAKQ